MWPMAGLVALFAGVFGLLFGSFGNVVIHRVPEGRSVVRPPSACPGCGNEISPRDNIPVLSWLLLRGKCRHCGQPISGRYPAVELTSGVMFAAVGWWLASMEPPDYWALPGMLLFAWMLLVVTFIDLATKRIPNALTYPLTPVLLVLLVGAAVLNGEPSVALRVVGGGLAAFGFLLLLALIYPRGMGMGDVKFAAFLGMGLGYVSWGTVVIGMFVAFLGGGIISSIVLAARKGDRKDQIPFGPFLAAGSFVALFVGPTLVDAYLRFSGLR